MRKRAIPEVPSGDPMRAGFDRALKENLEILMGQRGDKIKPLATTASTSEIAAKLNELIALLQ